MALAGHSTTLKISGTAVAVTGEATTSLGGNAYQITNTAKRIVSPFVAPVVKDGGTPIATTGYTFDYLFGIATLTAPPGGAVTMDVTYLPVAAVAEVRSFTFSASADLLETTSYDSAGVKTKEIGLVDASGSLEALSLISEDLDPDAALTQSFASYLAAGTPKLLEALFGSYYLRAWVMLESVEQSSEVAGLVTTTANFQLAPQAAGAAFGVNT